MSAMSFRNLLSAGDVEGLRAFWRNASPHLPQPESREQAEIVMHRARTEAESLPIDKRAYSHRWLCDRGLPSGLPDNLKPRAERIYPRVVEAVGISVNARSEMLKPLAREVERAMADAVEEAYADGRTDAGFIKARMAEVKDRTWRQLMGARL
ncbi:hypothetical protein ACQKOE_13850 [Novosphingobium sp. NPDC080210]|uniref:hypothetical protein n=1 Tax=Novosphingobium sp. NPDC080210 TaxID=3390596 RepID=UPI003D062315